jgi:hypothetical protein
MVPEGSKELWNFDQNRKVAALDNKHIFLKIFSAYLIFGIDHEYGIKSWKKLVFEKFYKN